MAHTLPAVVIPFGPGPRGTGAQQILLGFLQHCTVGVVLLEEQNARLRFRDRVTLLANESCMNIDVHMRFNEPRPLYLDGEACWLRA